MNTVKYEKRGRTAYVCLDRPDARNAVNDVMDRELADVWDDFAACADTDVAILHGTGASFCAGADLKSFIPKWLNAGTTDLRANMKYGLGGGITRGRHRLYKPVIAAVHGYAVGAGFELALCCDIRIAAKSATFGVLEIKKGLHQGDGGLTRLIAIAGMGTALELTLTGRKVSAEEAYRLGLVSRVVGDDKLLEAAEETASMMLENSQPAVRSAKETIYELMGRGIDDSLRLEAMYGYSGFGSAEELAKRLGIQK